MLRTLLINAFIFFLLPAQAGILPPIFYQGDVEKSAYCGEKAFHTEDHWRNLISGQIDLLAAGKSDVIKNSYVTLSYLELFNLPTGFPASSYMGYVYANGSHHLGRLVRYKSWPSEHPLRKEDSKLIRGQVLKLILEGASGELSRRLMHHSFNLYKTLAWSLAAAHLCGAEYAVKMVSDPDLRDAYSSQDIREFIRPFVTYEQTFLQENMYSDILIKAPAKAFILDEMRFISFNGEEQKSFYGWCREKKCKTSSYDLPNRIEFDTWSIVQELTGTLNRRSLLLERTEKARIRETAEVFLSYLH